MHLFDFVNYMYREVFYVFYTYYVTLLAAVPEG